MKTTLIDPHEQELKTATSVAKFLDIDPATLRRWAREGCPVHTLGNGLIRFRIAEVLEWRATRPSKGKGERVTRFTGKPPGRKPAKAGATR